jgi:predicted metal-binding protein
MNLREGEFARYDNEELELVALGDCGDCPGLIMPKITLMNEITASIDRDYDVIHLGTCVVKAKVTGECPLDFDRVSAAIQANFGKKVVIGTHAY